MGARLANLISSNVAVGRRSSIAVLIGWPAMRKRLTPACDVGSCARSGRRALNHGNVVEDPPWDRIADRGNPGCQGQVATPSRRPERVPSVRFDPLEEPIVGFPGASC